jgi:hypothetical protein
MTRLADLKWTPYSDYWEQARFGEHQLHSIYRLTEPGKRASTAKFGLYQIIPYLGTTIARLDAIEAQCTILAILERDKLDAPR